MGQYLDGQLQRASASDRAAVRYAARVLPYLPIALIIAAVGTDRYGVRLGGTNFRLELIAAAVGAVLVVLSQGLAPARRAGLVELCLVGWLGVATVSSALFSPARGSSLKLTLLLAGLLCLYGVTFALVSTGRAVVRAAATWVAIGSVVAGVGVAGAVAYIINGSTFGISFDGRYANGLTLLLPKVHSTLWEPNIFGSYELTVWALAFALSLAPDFQSAVRRRLLGLALLLSSSGILISLSRTDWVLIIVLGGAMVLIAVGLKLAPFGVIARRAIGPSVVGIAVGIGLGLAMQIEGCPTPAPINNGVPSQGSAGAAAGPVVYSGCTAQGSVLVPAASELVSPGSTSSATGRVSVVRLALSGLERRPILGWGTNAYLYVFGTAGGSWIGNLELHVLFDTGVVGFLLLLVAGVGALRRQVAGLRTRPVDWTEIHFASLGFLAGGSALLIAYQFTDGTWLGFTWVFFGLLVASGRITARSLQGATARQAPAVDLVTEARAPVQVTVAIVNWNSGPDLRACIDALGRNTAVPWNLVVVDNGSTDDSLDNLDAAEGHVRLIRAGRNLGFAGGVNVALDQIATPFALLLNPDAFVHPGCVDALLARAKACEYAAAVGSGLRNPDGSLQVACRNFPSPATHLVEAFRLYHLLRFVPGLGRRYLLLSKQDEPERVDWVVGACMLVRMAAVHDVGLFDESFFMYSEELDWCLRAHRKSWEVWFEPAAVATHRLGGSSRLNELPLMIESYRSMYHFYAKYYPPSWTAAARVITWFAMLARALVLPLRHGRASARLAAYREIARL